jgi:hypothetical protein
MGYMGFGMQKENYTRKPKKAFEKYKEKFDLERGTEGDPTNSAKFERRTFKHFVEGWIFKITFFFVVCAFIFYSAWEFILKQPIYEHARQRFEKHDIGSFYNTNRSMLSNLLRFAKQNKDRLQTLEYLSASAFSITLHNGEQGRTNYASFEKDRVYDSIKNGVVIRAKGLPIQKPWEYRLQFNLDDARRYQVLHYLHQEKDHLKWILSQMKAQQMSIRNDGDVVSIFIRHPDFGLYEFIFVESSQRIISEPSKYSTIRLGCLIDGSVYWRSTR